MLFRSSNTAFEAEEIDLALNKSTNRILNRIINRNVQDTEFDSISISSLIKKNKSLQIYKPIITDFNYEDEIVYSLLPSDFYSLLNDRYISYFSSFLI